MNWKFINQKTLATPKLFKDEGVHLRISDKYCRIYKVDLFPKCFDFGLLNYAFNGLPVKVFYKTKPLRTDMSKAITKERNKLEKEYYKEKNTVIKERKKADIEELDMMIQDLVSSNNYVLDITMIVLIYGDDKVELEDNCKSFLPRLTVSYGFTLSPLDLRQEEMFKELVPLWNSSGLVKDLQYEYALPLSTRSVAGMWNFYYEEVKDYKGFLLGYELNKGGLIQWNPFLWLDDPFRATQQRITAGNIFICGSTGSGKTTALTKIFKNLVTRKIKTIWIDPENKNETLVKQYKGKYVCFGLPDNIINVLSLRRVGVDEEEGSISPYDTNLAISNSIRDFKEILKLYHSEIAKEVHEACNVFDEIILETYKRHGIVESNFSCYKEIDYPIISDVAEVLDEYIEKRKKEQITDDYLLQQYVKLQAYLKPFLSSEAHYFNGHTNVDLGAGQTILGFGTKLLNNANDSLKNSVFYLLFQYASGFAYESSGRSAILWDEFHKYALIGYCLAILSDLQRRVRKYNTINILATQEPADIASDVLIRGVAAKTHGKAILNNSTYKLIMNLSKDATAALDQLVSINDVEKKMIESFMLGQGLLIKGSDHYNIQVYISEEEKKNNG